jgi:two-component system, NarL family, response regulator LiaR
MTYTTPIRVLIADDHAMVRSGLRIFLMAFDDLELAGEASSGGEAVRLTEQLKPDVVLMDLIMPGLDGIHATREIKTRFPQVQVVALTSFADPSLMQDALQAGAISFLLKDVSATELAGTIRSAFSGRPVLSPELAQKLIQSSHPAEPPVDLTEREKAVLVQMVAGKSNAEIAATLVISLSTVKFHVSSILSKLGVKSRGEAVSRALRSHLVDSYQPPV